MSSVKTKVRFVGGPWNGLVKWITIRQDKSLRIDVPGEVSSPEMWTNPIDLDAKPVSVVSYEIKQYVSGRWFGVVVGG